MYFYETIIHSKSDLPKYSIIRKFENTKVPLSSRPAQKEALGKIIELAPLLQNAKGRRNNLLLIKLESQCLENWYPRK